MKLGMLALGVALLGAGAVYAPRPASARFLVSQSRETFVVGMLRVDHFGVPGATPIIFIPALFCGASQWKREITQLADRYDIYAITLPGFDGRPRDTSGHLMTRATTDISLLITSRHLDHPIIIGHSLGATLAILFASDHFAQARGIVAVEGGYPAAPTDALRREILNRTIAPYVGIARASFADSVNVHMVRYIVTLKSQADSVSLAAGRSDPAAVVDWLTEAIPLDLTPQLPRIRIPLEEIVPFDSVIDPYQGFATLANKREAYVAFLSQAPLGSVQMIDHSRHFVMVDQPAAFDRALYSAIKTQEGRR